MLALWDQICVAGSSEFCEVERPRDRGGCRDRRKPEVPPKSCHFSATVAPPSSRLFLWHARNQPRTEIHLQLRAWPFYFSLYLQVPSRSRHHRQFCRTIHSWLRLSMNFDFCFAKSGVSLCDAYFLNVEVYSCDESARGLLFDGLLPV
jgi:hypothetical protein